ncbi:hypothetical protein BZA77DRAFT_294483 [Pyronema omphalodes]|nr:hypothetical protein BZA77DRAFT_294483 [Pyronema omphalodes]
MASSTPSHLSSPPSLVHTTSSSEDYHSEDSYADDYEDEDDRDDHYDDEDDDSSSTSEMPPPNLTAIPNTHAARARHLLSMTAGIERTNQENAVLQAKLNQLLHINLLLKQENFRLREELRIADLAMRSAEEMTKTRCSCDKCAENPQFLHPGSVDRELLVSLVQRIRDNENRQRRLMQDLIATRDRLSGDTVEEEDQDEEDEQDYEEDADREKDAEHKVDPDYVQDSQQKANLEPEEELKHKKPQSVAPLMAGQWVDQRGRVAFVKSFEVDDKPPYTPRSDNRLNISNLQTGKSDLGLYSILHRTLRSFTITTHKLHLRPFYRTAFSMVASPTSPKTSTNITAPLVKNELPTNQLSIFKVAQNIDATTSAPLGKYQQENTRPQEENLSLNIPTMETPYIRDDFNEHDQFKNKMKALEEKLKSVRKSKEDLLKQSKVLINANINVSSD